MDIFRILSRGASLKKLKGASADYALPSAGQEALQRRQEEAVRSQVEKETDFFHTRRHAAPQPDATAVEAAASVAAAPPTVASEDDAAALRRTYRCKVTGHDVPLPVGSFDDLTARYQLDPRLLRNLAAADFAEPTPIQCEAIPIALAERDLIACAPTGSGKTLAFLIPMVQAILASPGKLQGVRGLIVLPTNELALQIYDNLVLVAAHGRLQVAILLKALASKLAQGIVNGAKYDIIVLTPLRLIDVVKQGKLDLLRVQHLVIDEADKLLDHGFVEQTDDIVLHCTSPHVRKLMFLATIPSLVEEMAQSVMRDPVRVIIGHKEAANDTIEQRLVFTGNEEGKLVAIRQMILQLEFQPPVIIFLQLIARAKALFHELVYDKLNVDVIHAERTAKQRDEVIRRFRKGDVWVLIATDVLARGVDFKGVNLVINYDVPQSAQAYVHRIGRTGRNGRGGKAVTFFTKEDELAVKPILNVIKQLENAALHYSGWMEEMGKLSKRQKQALKQHEVKRKQISTVPLVVRNKRRQRQEMIEGSKRRAAAHSEPAAAGVGSAGDHTLGPKQ